MFAAIAVRPEPVAGLTRNGECVPPPPFALSLSQGANTTFFKQNRYYIRDFSGPLLSPELGLETESHSCRAGSQKLNQFGRKPPLAGITYARLSLG